MKRAIIQVSPEFIGMICKSTSKDHYLSIKSVLPEDAKYISSYYSFSRCCFMVMFEHKTFDDVPEGLECPILEAPVYARKAR